LKQETKFPDAETTTLTIEATDGSVRSLYLRHPDWSGAITVMINGKKTSVKSSKSAYFTLTRNWKAGDRIEVTYPMKLWLSTTTDNPDVAAVMYGPIVLAGRMGTEGFTGTEPYSDPSKYNDYYTYDYHVPASLSNRLSLDRSKLENSLQRVPGEGLKFKTKDGGLLLEPISRIHRERYVIYWNLKE